MTESLQAMPDQDVKADAGTASLDPLAFPLQGSRLIEASAGTGKTYTIAALYVRLVLGEFGHPAATPDSLQGPAARALTPPEILVVTFTEAATKELRGRIRARLAEAARCFLADPATKGGAAGYDDFLLRLRAATPPEHWMRCARRLNLAAEWMDEAAISTIHGWCNRMLREYAFVSGSLLNQRLETDQSELFAEVVRDYWRTFIVPLPPEAVAEVRKHWPAPEHMEGLLKRLGEALDGIPEVAPPTELLPQRLAERTAVLAQLKQPWTEWVAELRDALDGARERKLINGSKLKQNNYYKWLDDLAAWAADPARIDPGLSAAALARLTPDGIAEVWKDGEPLQHPGLDALAALPEQLSALPEVHREVLYHAAHWVAARFASEQQRRAQMGFNDLLTRLDEALQGEQGPLLAQRIREAFPVALIDEFQDTDPLQYRIFDAIYRVRDNDPDTVFVLIGDPKQAIYAFRGADIHTYLQARRDCGRRLHTLQRNFRSTPEMVEAVNRVFLQAEQDEAGEGAFLFRRAGDNPVPFVPASANGLREVLEVDGVRPVAMHIAWQQLEKGEKYTRGGYVGAMARACADEMQRLILAGQAGTAGFRDDKGGWRALRPSDLAVLVNAGHESDAIRAALAARGIRSVYLSDSASVFDTPQALELELWLAACAEPDDARRLRAALATATLAVPWSRLEQLNQDEQAWEALVQQFRGYHQRWQRQGVLPMLRHLLNDFDVPARLLAAAGGERRLTDILHLAELLQTAAAQLDGEQALLRYFAEQRESGGTLAEDVRQQRLESDADLVQVVTVHKSKGLEYPLVFFPFAARYRRTESGDFPLRSRTPDGRSLWLLEERDGALAQVDRERLGEDIRKLYVALTRARHHCWVGLAPLDDFADSGFGYLLGGARAVGQWEARLAALVAPEVVEVEVVESFLETSEETPVAPDAPAPAVPAPAVPYLSCQPQRRIHEHWWIASYSALELSNQLTAALDDEVQPAAGDASAETAHEDIFHEHALAQANPPGLPAASRAAHSMHTFPRGPEAGSFLHDILEWCATQGFAAVAAAPELLRDQIARRCARRGWTPWIEALLAWVQDLLQTRFVLPDTDFSLAGLTRPVAEMEFWLQVASLDAQHLDRLVCAQTLGGAARPLVQERRLNGMLKGFMDLVFEHEGRYYVADYKSNWLGPEASAYTPEALTQAVLHHRYDLQYVLYTLALHRLLRSRLAGYDYDRHVGGAVYLFLRGIEAPGQGVHFERPPRALIEALDAEFRGGVDL